MIYAKKSIMFVCVIMFGTSSAYSDTFLDKLKENLEEQSTVSYVSAEDAPNPVILTIDGVDKNAIEGGLLDKMLIGNENKRYVSSYLKPVVDQWEISDDVSFVGWSGDYVRTESEVAAVASEIVEAFARAKDAGRPLVLVTHSWGTVLSYRALKNLSEAGRLPENAVHSFVTMGSPLAIVEEPNLNGAEQTVGPMYARKVNIAGRVEMYGDWTGKSALNGVVGKWRNYWIASDDISRPIPDAESNPASSYIGLNSHSAYYKNTRIAADIRRQLVKDLKTFKAPAIAGPETVASTNEMVAQNTGQRVQASIRPESEAEVYGLRLGMTPEEVVSVLTSKHSDLEVRRHPYHERPLQWGRGPEEGIDISPGSLSGVPPFVGFLRAVIYTGSDNVSPPEGYEIQVNFLPELPPATGSFSETISFSHYYRELSFDPKEFVDNRYSEFKPVQGKPVHRARILRQHGDTELRLAPGRKFYVISLTWLGKEAHYSRIYDITESSIKKSDEPF